MKKLLLLFFFFTLYNYYCFAQKSKSNYENLFQNSIIKPIKVIKIYDNRYFYDFGKDAFGTLLINLKSPIKDSVIVQLGEKVNNDSTIDSNPGGTIRYYKVVLTKIPINTDFYVKLKPEKRHIDGRAIFTPDSFGVITPFRYCEIKNLSVPIENIEVKQKVYNFRFDDNASSFISSDTILNQVWEMCKHTIKATSFCGLYIDGDRERTPYEADAYINQLSHYCVDTEYELAQRTNEFFIHHPTWPTEWILHTILLFYTDYMYTGNAEFLKKYYPQLKSKTLIDLAGKDGLISSFSPIVTDSFMTSIGFRHNKDRIKDIVDWPLGERDNFEMDSINTVVNSFHYISLKLMAEISGVLEKRNDSIFFQKQSTLVKKSINSKLLNKEKGIYVDGEGSSHSSLHANMFPLAFGIVPTENLQPVLEFIKSKGMACSVYGAQYLLEALYQYGASDYALKLLTSTNDRSWWHMIELGSTMTMEAWDMKYKPNLDWNHAWGTAPLNIITRYMWGIRPNKPAFDVVDIKPQLSKLTFSKIKVPTIKGSIIADYKQFENGNYLFIIDIPKGMEGKFYIPNYKYKKILLNNKKMKSYKNLLRIYSGINRIEMK